MRKDEDKCNRWNANQVEMAVKMIAQEQSRGNAAAIGIPDNLAIGGYNRDRIPSLCHVATRTGCSDSDNIAVKADRDPAAIAFTIQHEVQHIVGRAFDPALSRIPAAGKERCARYTRRNIPERHER